jgi:P-type Ca2+ transporter type 2C
MDDRPAYALSASDVVQRLQSDSVLGLSDQEAADRLKRLGENRLAAVAGTPRWKRLLSQFQGLIIGLLLVSAAIAGILGEWVDAIVIVAIVVINGVLGFLQEDRAEKALDALRKLAAPKARVRRNGVVQTIPASDLVEGDILELEAGDHIAADARLITAYGLQLSEASLTGESHPSEKTPATVLPSDTVLGDRRNMVYSGTIAIAGKARAIVTATGMETEIGSIAGMLQQTETEPTPLQRRLTELGRVMVGACLAIVSVIFVLQWLRGGELIEVFLTSVSLAVAAVPEGLPAVVTITLAIGLSRMAKRNAIIRKLPSVETLGCISVICSDKTGTLTSNQMTVSLAADSQVMDV